MESNAEAKEKAKKEVFEDEKEDEEDGGGAATEDEKKKRVTAMATAASASLKKGGMNHLQAPSCQAEKCAVDLTDAKRYHRRHKVCEQHSKAPVVIVAGLRQRFCQQCSRFHELSEFDEAKRSCRRRLAGHNERRRKNSSESHLEGSSRRAVGPQLKENHCRQADQSGRTQLTLPGSPPYKHFQIR
ncbi:hypothetical protein MRB53_030408 [Persea americana]|uniref:Uncharacterized protein n=2 Tax=Persea americana TaxID=3435 RepID=A0ACC2KL54_PERAE|nr:hypothetical protein MRB53_030408 [Persea americana]QCC72926.1 SQUAMOSA promoter-binding protein-like protein 4 [Persea americana]